LQYLSEARVRTRGQIFERAGFRALSRPAKESAARVGACGHTDLMRTVIAALMLLALLLALLEPGRARGDDRAGTNAGNSATE